jgi:thiamine biosynthesis lipoprotein
VRQAAWVLAAALLAAAAACSRPGGDFHQQLHALGTQVTLRFYGTDARSAGDAGAALERLYRQLGTDWYPWAAPQAGGELTRINDAIARGETAAVSPRLAALLKRATALERRSGGRFNVALGAFTALWGFDRPFQNDWRPPSHDAVQALLASEPGGGQLHWDGLLLASDNRELVLDPGGIAKGALLALSIEILERHGIDNAIVDLGGDLSVIGTVNGRAARIGIRDPAGGPPPGHIEVASGESVLTSGNYERYFRHDGRRYAHIIDPRSGYPARGTASVTVVHEDPVLADAAATALLVAGAGEFDRTCQALGIEQALLIDASGDLRLTPEMRKRVHWQAR